MINADQALKYLGRVIDRCVSNNIFKKNINMKLEIFMGFY